MVKYSFLEGSIIDARRCVAESNRDCSVQWSPLPTLPEFVISDFLSVGSLPFSSPYSANVTDSPSFHTCDLFIWPSPIEPSSEEFSFDLFRPYDIIALSDLICDPFCDISFLVESITAIQDSIKFPCPPFFRLTDITNPKRRPKRKAISLFSEYEAIDVHISAPCLRERTVPVEIATLFSEPRLLHPGPLFMHSFSAHLSRFEPDLRSMHSFFIKRTCSYRENMYFSENLNPRMVFFEDIPSSLYFSLSSLSPFPVPLSRSQVLAKPLPSSNNFTFFSYEHEYTLSCITPSIFSDSKLKCGIDYLAHLDEFILITKGSHKIIG